MNALRQAIESGELEVGTRLSAESELGRQFGVSRSVIREALRSSNALGLTVTRIGRGTFVVADHVAHDLVLGKFSALHLMEARPHIEVPAAGLAAERCTAADIESLRAILQAMSAENDPQVWVRLDGSFHAAIARVSGNRVFELVVADIREAMANQSETINLITGRTRRSDAEHQAIFDAIARGAPVEAAHAMQVHLAAVGEALATILTDGAK